MVRNKFSNLIRVEENLRRFLISHRQIWNDSLLVALEPVLCDRTPLQKTEDCPTHPVAST